jgi:hypothetical protein
VWVEDRPWSAEPAESGVDGLTTAADGDDREDGGADDRGVGAGLWDRGDGDGHAGVFTGAGEGLDFAGQVTAGVVGLALLFDGPCF